MISSMLIKLLLSVSLIVLSCPEVCFPAEISNRIVAFVNDDVITLYELNNRIEELTGQTSDTIRAQDEEAFIETRRQILESMINEKIAQEQVEKLELQVSEAEIDSYIENIKESNNWTQEDLIAELRDQGMTLEALRKQIREEQEQRSLIDYEVTSKAIILEGELLTYYEEHIDEYKEDEIVQIANIFLMAKDQGNKDELNELTKKGEAILAKLKDGESFEDLALEFSDGPGADEGGELGEFVTSQLDPELKNVIDGLKDDDISGLITRETGIQIIKLIKRTGGEIKPFEEVRSKIYESIYNEELNKRYTAWLKDLRESSFTKIIF